MDNLNNMALHTAIKQMRLSRKLTQVMLAGKLDISTFTLIRWERGERLPDGKYLQKLTEILKYTIVLDTDGLWTCFPRDELLTSEEGQSISTIESVDELYKRAVKAKDNAAWKIFFSRLVKDNTRLESWLRETNGGEDMDDETFQIMSDVILAVVKSGR
jgi:transcriptional regulator with XRE-family HTH domain